MVCLVLELKSDFRSRGEKGGEEVLKGEYMKGVLGHIDMGHHCEGSTIEMG